MLDMDINKLLADPNLQYPDFALNPVPVAIDKTTGKPVWAMPNLLRSPANALMAIAHGEKWWQPGAPHGSDVGNLALMLAGGATSPRGLPVETPSPLYSVPPVRARVAVDNTPPAPIWDTTTNQPSYMNGRPTFDPRLGYVDPMAPKRFTIGSGNNNLTISPPEPPPSNVVQFPGKTVEQGDVTPPNFPPQNPMKGDAPTNAKNDNLTPAQVEAGKVESKFKPNSFWSWKPNMTDWKSFDPKKGNPDMESHFLAIPTGNYAHGSPDNVQVRLFDAKNSVEWPAGTGGNWVPHSELTPFQYNGVGSPTNPAFANSNAPGPYTGFTPTHWYTGLGEDELNPTMVRKTGKSVPSLGLDEAILPDTAGTKRMLPSDELLELPTYDKPDVQGSGRATTASNDNRDQPFPQGDLTWEQYKQKLLSPDGGLTPSYDEITQTGKYPNFRYGGMYRNERIEDVLSQLNHNFPERLSPDDLHADDLAGSISKRIQSHLEGRPINTTPWEPTHTITVGNGPSTFTVKLTGNHSPELGLSEAELQNGQKAWYPQEKISPIDTGDQ
jgi:hypothetical protein